jgi:hypothetical protein
MLANAFLILETLRRKKLLGGPCRGCVVNCSICFAHGPASVVVAAQRARDNRATVCNYFAL